MRSRRILSIIAAAVALVVLVRFVTTSRHGGVIARTVAPAQAQIDAAAAAPRTPKLATLAAQIPPESISGIADELNAPGGSIHQDLEILNALFVAWQTNFPHDGNPVGENDEITAALAGDNRLHFAFVAPTNPAINAQGQLCDRWGTPLRFHQLSGTQMELRSAGPDRRFGTADDVQFAPGRNPL